MVVVVTWLILGVVLIAMLTVWLTWTAMRIDRLTARMATAWLSLDAALVRRSAALRAVIDETPELRDRPSTGGIRAVVASAQQIDRPMRAATENTISAAIGDLEPNEVNPQALDELRVACDRVRVARTFYNDAVRAAGVLRSHRIARWSGLARRLGQDGYFDIDDSPGSGWTPAQRRAT